MPGKSKREKKKRAKVKKRTAEELKQKSPKKIVLGMLGEKKTAMSKMAEQQPFDPKSVVANILKKKNGG